MCTLDQFTMWNIKKILLKLSISLLLWQAIADQSMHVASFKDKSHIILAFCDFNLHLKNPTVSCHVSCYFSLHQTQDTLICLHLLGNFSIHYIMAQASERKTKARKEILVHLYFSGTLEIKKGYATCPQQICRVSSLLVISVIMYHPIFLPWVMNTNEIWL